MITINYYLRDKSKKGETPINLFVGYKGKRKKFPTGFKTDPKNWNDASQRMRLSKGDQFREDINYKLDLWEKDISTEYNKIRLRGDSQYEFESINELITKILNSDSSNTLNTNPDSDQKIELNEKPQFFTAYEEFIYESENGLRLNDKGKKIGKDSIQKYKRTKLILKEFSKKYPISFESIDMNFYGQFINFLNNYKVRKRTQEELQKNDSLSKYIIGFKINTIGKFIRTIKAFMSFATEKGYNQNLAYKSKKFKAFNIAVDNISLSEEEVGEIYKLDLTSTPELELTRDLFILGCWTGLRFDNLINVKNDYINKGMLNFPSISKSDNRITIPLHNTALKIIEKYNGWPPKISSPIYNKNIKLIAEQIPTLNEWFSRSTTQAGVQIEEKFRKYEIISAHTSRRTFATIHY